MTNYEKMTRSLAAHALHLEQKSLPIYVPSLRERENTLIESLNGFQPRTTLVNTEDDDTTTIAKVIWENLPRLQTLPTLTDQKQLISDFFSDSRAHIVDLINTHDLPKRFLTLAHYGEETFYRALGVSV